MKVSRGISRSLLVAAILVIALIGIRGGTNADDLTWTTGPYMITPRVDLSGATIGEVIYAIGGKLGATVFDKVEAYDSSTGAWSTRANMPGPRLPESVAVDGRIYVVGGVSGTYYYSSLDRYDPDFNAWTALAPMQFPRAFHSVAAINGEIYAIGGLNTYASSSVYVSVSVEKYNIQKNTWSASPAMPTPRWSAVAAVVGKEIFVIGGYLPSYESTNTVEAFDTHAGTWTTKAPMPMSRYGHDAIVFNGKIYIAGGLNEYAADVLAAVDEYDPLTNSWTTISNMPTGRFGLIMQAINNKIYAIGGHTKYCETVVNEIGTFPSISAKITVLPSPVQVGQPTLINLVVKNYTDSTIHNLQGSLEISKGACMLSSLSGPNPSRADLAPGGFAEFSWQFTVSVTGALTIEATASSSASGTLLSVTESYSEDGIDQCAPPPPCDETNLTWIMGSSMGVARTDFATEVVSGKIYAFGGGYGSSYCLASAERYDPATGTWTNIESMPAARYGLAASAIGATIYVIGGVCSTDFMSDGDAVNAYDTVNNSWWPCADLPEPRSGAVAATVNGIVYLFGGYFGGAKNTTWAFDAVTGIWVTKAPMPWARYNMAASVLDGRIYVMGGRDDPSGTASTVAAYDPVTDSWEIKESMISCRLAPASGVIDGKIYVMSGVGGPGDSSGEMYDPAINTWKKVTSMPGGTWYPQGAVCCNKLHVIGGYVSGAGSASMMVASVCSSLPIPPVEPAPTPPPGPALPSVDNLLYVYPHPLKCPGGYAVFDMDKQGVAVLRIMNIRGQLVKEIYSQMPAMEDAQVFIDCNVVGRGTYILSGQLSYSDGTSKVLNPYKFVVVGKR